MQYELTTLGCAPFEEGAGLCSVRLDSARPWSVTGPLDGHRWTQFTVANVYSLSKSTQLYADLMFETTGGGAVADTLGIGTTSGGRQTVLLTGIHHLF